MGVNGIYGLSGSGLDIESLVKVGMMSKQNEYDKMAQKYTKNEWTKTALLDLSSQITTFNMSSLTDYKLSTTMNARTATSSDETAVTATANATSPLMTHKVTVDKLSSNAYLTSYATITDIIASTNNISKTSEQAATLANAAELKDILFNSLKEDYTKVTTKYDSTHTAGTDNFAGYDVYSTSATSTAVITETGIKFDNNDNNMYVKYKDTNGNYHDYSATVTGEGTTTTKTTTVTSASFSNGINVTATHVQNTANDSDDSDTTTYKINGYTKRDDGIYTNADETSFLKVTGTDNGEITLTSVNENGNTLTSDADNDPSTPEVPVFEQTLTANFVSKTAVDTITYDGGTKTVTKTLDSNDDTTSEKSVLDYGGGKSLTVNTDGSKVLDFNGTKVTINASNNVTTETYEKGITGTTLKTSLSSGDPRLVSYGFANGQQKSITRDDVALEFTLADSKDANAKTATISITYDDILGDSANDKKAMTMNDFVSKIKEAINTAGLDLNATYDNINQRFAIYNTNGDVDSSIVIKATNNNTNAQNARNYAGYITTGFFDALKLRNFNGTGLDTAEKMTGNGTGGGTISVSGLNGNINVDGIDYATKDNKVTVGGITYSATNLTKDVNGNIAAATVTVGQDVDGIVDKVKSFVESYNKILGSLYDAYNEKPESGYTPLTQSQKDSMKEEQIEKWEEKAKKGLLYHDQTLYKIINQMRNSISNEVEGLDSKYNSAYSIGISTTGIYGQLKLDEDKLKAALAEDSDAAYNVFGKLVTTTDSTGKLVTDTEKSGVAQRLSDVFVSATKSIRTRAGSSADITEDSDLNNLLRELQTKMSNFKKLMSAFEDKLYKKYDAMEVALSKLGSQLSFITGGQ